MKRFIAGFTFVFVVVILAICVPLFAIVCALYRLVGAMSKVIEWCGGLHYDWQKKAISTLDKLLDDNYEDKTSKEDNEV